MDLETKYLNFVKKYLNDSPHYYSSGSGISAFVGYFLGMVFSFGICLFFYSNIYTSFGLAISALSYFHLWEFTFVAIFRYKELTFNSFLLNHSKEYNIAMVFWLVGMNN
jgi:hypothetical protein